MYFSCNKIAQFDRICYRNKEITVLDQKTHAYILDMQRAYNQSQKRIETAEHFLRYCRSLQKDREEKFKLKQEEKNPITR